MKLKTVKIFYIAAIFIVFCLFELYLREKTRTHNKNLPSINNLILYTAPVVREPNGRILFRFYGPEKNKLLSADIQLNNIGLMSSHDYKTERDNREFRIVILGGEQSASSISSVSWPDYLQESLNKHRKHEDPIYKVLNFAWPDAGPEKYIEYWEEAKLYSPDLVIVNLVETDFFRNTSAPRVTIRGYPIEYTPIKYTIGLTPDDVASLQVTHPVGSKVYSFADPEAVPSRPYGFFVTESFANNPLKIGQLQERVVDDMISGSFPTFGGMILRSLQKRNLSPLDVGLKRNFDPTPMTSIDLERAMIFGLTTFGKLFESIPNLVFTHNFHHLEIDTKWNLTEMIMKNNNKIKIIDMRTCIPIDTPITEIKNWYHVGIMDEKWSDSGHMAYAQMIKRVIYKWRSGERGFLGC